MKRFKIDPAREAEAIDEMTLTELFEECESYGWTFEDATTIKDVKEKLLYKRMEEV